jgi:hypothetical protein
MRDSFGEIVKGLRRALNVSEIELIDLLASTAINGHVTKPSGNSIRMWSKKPPKRLQKAHVKLFRTLLGSWTGGVADEGAYREIKRILEEYFPESKERNLADAEARYRSYLLGDQEDRCFLQNYEGCYVLTRHESGECNLRQDILVLKAYKNKLLATLITKNNVLRGFGVIVKGALSLSLGSNAQEMHPKTAASIILRREANQINDMLGGYLIGLSIYELIPVAMLVILVKVRDPSPMLIDIHEISDQEIRSRMKSVDNLVSNPPKKTRELYELNKKISRRILSCAKYNSGLINETFRHGERLNLDINEDVVRICRMWV